MTRKKRERTPIDTVSSELFRFTHHYGEVRHFVGYGADLAEAYQCFKNNVGCIDDEVEVNVLSARYLGPARFYGDSQKQPITGEAWEFEYGPREIE